MLFEYFGKHIVQPCCDLFEKATRLAISPISQSSSTGFLSAAEARAPMELARHYDLLNAHAMAARHYDLLNAHAMAASQWKSFDYTDHEGWP